MGIHAAPRVLNLNIFESDCQLPAPSSMYIKTQDIYTIYGLIFVRILRFHPKKSVLVEDI